MTAEERAKEATRLVTAGKEDFEQKGDIDSAMSKFEKALELAPDWKKARKDYAELLYLKGLGYDQDSQRAWQRALGKEFDESTRVWRQSGGVISEEEKAKLGKDFAEAKKTALIYYHRSIDQLQLLDRMMGGADEDVICAMAIVHVFLDEFDQAKDCFRRVLESPRVEEKVKEKIRAAIEAINEFQKQQPSSGE
jgi:tetratricopeptide (TPR) repeat protein